MINMSKKIKISQKQKVAQKTKSYSTYKKNGGKINKKMNT